MVSLSAYRSVLSRPGALRFSAAGLVGRLPIAMAGLGIALLVQDETGSYGVAGGVAAAYLAANAVVAVPLGRLVDRWGQGRVLSATSVLFGLSMATLIATIQLDLTIVTTYVAAALAGATLPPIDACVRTRWAHVLDEGHEVETAFALEAVVDESVFITGPILVTVLATLVHPTAGIATATLAGLLGGLAFAVQRGTEPPAHPRDPSVAETVPLPWRTLAPVGVVCVALGTLFGSAEVTTVAFADEQGAKSAAGGLLAIWALGSLTAGVVTGLLTWRRDLTTRVRWGALSMACAMAPLGLVDSIWVMGVVMLLGGLTIAPTMIATTALIEQATPTPRLTEGMAVLQTGLVAGVAPGAAIAGAVIDRAGSSTAYLVPLVAGLAAALAALSLPRRPVAPGRAPAEDRPGAAEVVR
jgi:MFS family permease